MEGGRYKSDFDDSDDDDSDVWSESSADVNAVPHLKEHWWVRKQPNN